MADTSLLDALNTLIDYITSLYAKPLGSQDTLAADALEVRLVDEGVDWPAWIAASVALLTLGYLWWTVRHAKGALADARSTRHGQLILDINGQWIYE